MVDAIVRSDSEWSQRNFVVSGAASGIGRRTCERLVEKGARVIGIDISRIEGLSYPLHAVDVRSVSEIRQLAHHLFGELGEIAGLVNSAGIPMVRTPLDVTEEDWDRCMETNVKGAWFLSQAVVRFMHRGGSIVNVSSNAGILPRAHDPVYSISKAALNGMTRSLALSLSTYRIRVNAVCPGPVSGTGIMDADLDQAGAGRNEKEQQIISASPLARAHGRMITTDEVADAILYLLSDAATMVTGTLLAIDGGKSLGVPPV